MKIRSNLPYYEKMKAKLESEIKQIKEALESKETELQSIDSVIANLSTLEKQK